jgi:hypothetical protein
MAEETDGQTAPQNPFAGEGLPDPATWEDPKESFPGIIEVSEIIPCTQEYLEKFCSVRDITGAAREKIIADSFPRWDLRIKRLDCELQLPDGSRVAAMRYGGFDLRKWNNQQSALIRLNSRHAKEHMVRTAYQKVFGTIEPPSVLVGKMFMFDFYGTKNIRNFAYTNVVVPTTVLAPDYTFEGEVRVIIVTRDEDAGTTEDAASNGTGTVEQLSETAAMDVVVGAIVGQKATDPAGLIGAVPQEAQLNSIVSGLALGKEGLVKELVEAGKVAIGDDGIIVAA